MALHDPEDQHHEEAVAAWSRLEPVEPRLVTTQLVVVESITLIARALGSPAGVEFGRVCLSSPSLEVHRPLGEDDSDALDEMARFEDQDLGFVDALSFVTLRRLAIPVAFTFDRRHFSLAGVELFP